MYEGLYEAVLLRLCPKVIMLSKGGVLTLIVEVPLWIMNLIIGDFENQKLF